jgi:hypothetical protein
LKLFGIICVLTLVSASLQSAPDGPGAPPPPPISPAEILDRYAKAIQAEQSHPQPVSMDVDMDAELPRLKKQGRLHAFRFITRVGQIFYPPRDMRYEGDNTIKKEVIARYIQAEKEARNNTNGSMAVTAENYKFKYKGTADYAGKTGFVFQVAPKKKRVGLYKGELWIDKDTFLPLREWGVFVKSPSVFLKNVYFVRDYMLCDGIAIPRRLISDINTRIVGKAQLTIWYENVKVGDNPAASAQVGGGSGTTVSDGAVH